MKGNKIIGIITLLTAFALVAIGCQSYLSNDEAYMAAENVTEDMEVMEDAVSTAVNGDEDMVEELVMNEGPMATDFTLMDLEGNTVSLSDLQGEKVYIKFWASWCPICLSGLEEIDTLSGKMTDFKVLTIVSPNFNGEQNEADFKAWFETKGTEHMTVLLDHDGIVTKAYGVRGYPTSSFMGSDGVLVEQFPGHLTEEQIMRVFESIK